MGEPAGRPVPAAARRDRESGRDRGDPAVLNGGIPGWIAVVALVGFWLVVGIVTGAQQAGAVRMQGRPELAGDVWLRQVLSALPWIALTPAIAWLVHRVPLRGPSHLRALGIHAVAAVLTAFVANVAMVLLYRAVDSPFVSTGPLLEEAFGSTLQWLHIVVLVYAGIAVAAEMALRRGGPRLDRPDPRTGRIPFQEGSGTLLLAPDELDWLEADGDYVRLHVAGRDHLVNHRLSELAERLAPAGFVRIHRSTVVNRSRVRAVEPVGRGDREVVLVDGTRLRLSRRRSGVLDRLVPVGDASGLPSP